MAGTVSEPKFVVGHLLGAVNRPVRIEVDVVAGADASLPVITIPGVSGLVSDIEIVMDGTTPPNTITYTPETVDGVPKATAITKTASGDVKYDPPLRFCNGIVLNPTAGNTTNSAKFTVIFLVL